METDLSKKERYDLKLLDFLEREKIIKAEQLKNVTDEARLLGVSSVELLSDNLLIPENKIVNKLSEVLGFPKVNLATASIDKEVLREVNPRFAIDNLVFPLKLVNKTLTIVMFNPFQLETIMELENSTGHFVKTVLATRTEILDSINLFYYDDEKNIIDLKEFANADNLDSAGEVVDENSDQKFLSILENLKIISHEQSNFLTEKAKTLNVSPINYAINKNLISQEKTVTDIAKKLGLGTVKIADLEKIETRVLDSMDYEFARQNVCIPLEIKEKSVLVAVFNPFRLHHINKFYDKSNLMVFPKLATRTDILEGIFKYYRKKSVTEDIKKFIPEIFVEHPIDKESFQIKEKIYKIEEKDVVVVDEAPVVRIVDFIIYNAIRDKVSDIHMEPGFNFFMIRYRKDGVLHEVQKLPRWIQLSIVSRVKILSKMDISEKRVPQDGSITVEFENRDVDIRVSTLPTHHGEKVVMRILDKESAGLRLGHIGFTTQNLDLIQKMIQEPQGTILVTGPTGSGKTSTLYACLNELNSPEVNIVTVEDPVEYELEGINQVQVHKKANLTFANTLRSILRQDPDIVMIGEIRDHETAEIAFNAAITGHMVFSTLHTNSAVSAVTRLMDLGVQPFLISSAVLLIIAQRLLRKNCKNCIVEYKPETEHLYKIGIENINGISFKKGKGCSVCNNTGYKGRIGVFEILYINSSIKEAINRGESEEGLKEMLQNQGAKFLIDDAIEKIREGVTSVEEVNRIVAFKEANNILCGKCNHIIDKIFAVCPFCGDQKTKHCEICGSHIESDWVVCPTCRFDLKKD